MECANLPYVQGSLSLRRGIRPRKGETSKDGPGRLERYKLSIRTMHIEIEEVATLVQDDLEIPFCQHTSQGSQLQGDLIFLAYQSICPGSIVFPGASRNATRLLDARNVMNTATGT